MKHAASRSVFYHEFQTASFKRISRRRSHDTPKGRRDHAILLLLARTGLRAVEVAQLTLDDINWQEGNLWIRSGKSRRERRLPLAEEVGAALYAYLVFNCNSLCI